MLRNSSFVVCVAAFIATVTPASAATFVVNGTDNPFLAGQAAGTGDGFNDGDTTYNAAPLETALIPGTTSVTFTSVAGQVSNDGSDLVSWPLTGPNGSLANLETDSTTNGILGYTNAPLNALVGVFVGATAPNASGPNTDFSSATTTPQLDQIFYIGDGTLGGISPATFVVPNQAIYLYLGTVDGFQWNNNAGAFDVTATGLTAVPEPSTWAFLLAGFSMMGYALRRRRQASVVTA